ncbi:MAG: hypothetical protein ABUL43_02025, partial [Hyphomicrobium sp.]
MHGPPPGSAAHETPLRFSVYGESGRGTALVTHLAAAAVGGTTRHPSAGGALTSFTTQQRVFIVDPAAGATADASGEAIEPPSADLAIVVVPVDEGMSADARRHLAVARALGARHAVLAVDGL